MRLGMRLLKTKQIYVLVFGVVFSLRASSQIPTTDLVNFSQNVLSYLEQIDSALTQLEQFEAQIRQLEDGAAMLESMRGIRNFSDLMNSDAFRGLRRSIPDSPRELIRGLANGDIADGITEEYEDILGDVLDVYDSLDAGSRAIRLRDLREKSDELKSRSLGVKTAGIANSYAAVEYSAGNMEIAEELIGQIDGAPDMKASTDLNSRILAELLIQSNQQMKFQGTADVAEQEEAVARLQEKKLFKTRFNFQVNEL